MQPLIYTNLPIFYGFLAFTFLSILCTSKSPLLQRTFSKRIFPGSTICFGEFAWFYLMLFALLGAGVPNFNYWWNRRAPKWFPSKPFDGLVYETLFSVSGSTITLLIGFIMLPVSKNSALADFFNLPYTSLLRVHIWVGKTLFFFVIFHLGTGLAYYVALKKPLVETLFIVPAGSVWGKSAYQDVTGVAATVILAVVLVTSLAYFRRRWYNAFFFTHALVFAFIVLGYIHASSNIFFCIPGLCLYCIDGLLRLSALSSKDTVSNVHFEKNGYISVTVSTSKPVLARPGQFMRVSFPAVTKFEYHPWSIVNTTDRSVTFLFVRSVKDTEWSSKVADTLQTYADKGHDTFSAVRVHMQGPYGKAMEIIHPVASKDALVFYVGGTGVAACVHAIEQTLAANRVQGGKRTKVVLLWASRGRKLAQLSHLQSWLLEQDVTVELFETGGDRSGEDDDSGVSVSSDAGDAPKITQDMFVNLSISSDRPQLGKLLEKHVVQGLVPEVKANLELGVFVCGPEEFTKHALKDLHLFERKHFKEVRVTVEVESFDI
ncbi:hypothetical protein HDU98_005193 [Podochytrium sp. JEL0797]|nr:hypothetical protein HDU98_005193 [Podochytrium sp. JEL0797]